MCHRSSRPQCSGPIDIHGTCRQSQRDDDHRAADEPLSAQPIPESAQTTAIRVHRPTEPRWTVLGTLVATSCGLLATAVAVTLLRPANPSPQPRRTLQRITYDEAALPRDAAWAPDGRWVVYASDRAGNADLWKQRLGDPDPVRLTTSEANESQPQWSPDGQSIVFRSERDGGGLYVIPASGGVERIVSTFGYEPRVVTGRNAHSLQAFGGASRLAHDLRGRPGWKAAAARPARRARSIQLASCRLAS